MTIEIVSIGSELLSGHTVNQNATTIARMLRRYGYTVSRVTTLSDALSSLTAGLRQILSRADLVIATGGLGPTQDDRTRQAVADLVKQPLVTDDAALNALKKRYGAEKIALSQQASVPQKGTLLPNPIGTAVGFAIEVGASLLFALPGVPVEMDLMLEKRALPLIAKRGLKQHDQRALFFCLRNEGQFDAFLRILAKKYPLVDIGICPSYGIIAIYLTAQATSASGVGTQLNDVVAEVKGLFPTHLFSTESAQVEIALQQALIKRRKTLAVAESCTGGKLAARMTALAGISEAFVGGIVAYANEVKKTVLEVSEKTLAQAGAVSRQTVIEMTQGALKKTAADYVLTTSGVAGPTGGTLEKPVGTIWMALGEKKGTIYSHCLQLPQKWRRDHIIEYVVTYLIASLWRYLIHQEVPFEEKR
ncbi:MAG: nicotinamide-nucleotide amidohydrolase family protein [Chlamydiota bacterium]